MTSLSSLSTHGCFLLGIMDLCISRLFKSSLTWFSSTKGVFLTPDFATGLRDRWFLKASLSNKDRGEEGIEYLKLKGLFRNMFGLIHVADSFCRPLPEFMLGCCRSELLQTLWTLYPWSWESAYIACSCLSVIAGSTKFQEFQDSWASVCECKHNLEVTGHFPWIHCFFPGSKSLEITDVKWELVHIIELILFALFSWWLNTAEKRVKWLIG